MINKGFTIKLSNIADVLQGQSPKSIYYSNIGGTPFLQGNRTFGALYPKIDTFTSKVTKLAKKGEVLMSVRAPVGDLNFANCDLCIGRGLSSIKSKTGNNKFIYYALKYNIANLIKQGGATTFDSVNKDIINDFELIIPKDETNRNKVESILSTIDGKIELNNSINSELEEMANILYNYWFIQFDFPDKNGKPYKSNGGKMEYNTKLKREIPKNWEVKEMNQLLDKNNKKFNINGEKHSIDTIDLSVMPSSTMCLNNKNNSDEFGTNLFKMNKYDILFGGIRPYLLKAGFAPFDGLVTGTVLSYKVKNEFEYNFSLLTMTHESVFNYAVTNSKGTKMPVIGTDDLLSYIIPYNSEVIKKFNEIISFKEIISLNILENKKLEELRDWLLPMLMNEQVEVN